MLFFAEMWERFSFYGMRALLVLYMMQGFLEMGDADAYGVYGAYGALVYATPFIGGAIADRFLGARRAVVLGGILMAAGHLLMSIEQSTAFYTALALLIVGNGFFKPNISTIVGSLYDGTDLNRDGGFTIFYMGINLGAASASSQTLRLARFISFNELISISSVLMGFLNLFTSWRQRVSKSFG